MITLNNREISKIAKGTGLIGEVKHGLRLVWQRISSCFGAGFWRSEAPWVGSDAWKNNS